MSEHDDQNIPSGLKALRGLKVEPSPYLAKRIEANWRATLKPSVLWRERVLRWVAPLAIGALVAVAVLRLPSRETAGALYALHQPYLIRVDVRELPREQIAFAEIDLDGDSAHFASKKFADIADHRTITITGDKLLDKQYLPIIVEGEKSGTTTVTANFYSAAHELIATKQLTLVFKGASI